MIFSWIKKYKNGTVYQTTCGGLATILSYFSYIIFILFQLRTIIQKENTVTDSKNFFNLYNDESPYYLSKEKYDISISFEWSGSN